MSAYKMYSGLFQVRTGTAINNISLCHRYFLLLNTTFHRCFQNCSGFLKTFDIIPPKTVMQPCARAIPGKLYDNHRRFSRIHLDNIPLNENKLSSRPLGPLETLYHVYYQNGEDVFTGVHCLNTRIPVTPIIVKLALQGLICKHPLLSMCILSTDTQNSFMLSPMKRKEIYIHQSDNSNYLEFMIEDSKQPFDCERGPLWRLTLLNNHCNSKKHSKHNFAFTFTSHHSIFDGVYCFELMKDFIEYIHLVQTGRFASLISKPIPQILSNFENFLPHKHSKKSWELAEPPPNIINIALKVYEETFFSEINELGRKSTSVGVERSKLTPSQSKTFLLEIKAKEVTLTSSCIAAASIAFCKILEPSLSEDTENYLIPVHFMVDLRRYATGEKMLKYPGCANIHVPLYVSVPLHSLGQNSSQLFWELSQTCYTDLRNILNSGTPIELMKSLSDNVIQGEKMPTGKSPYVIQVSNLLGMENIVKPNLKENFRVMSFQTFTNITIRDMPIFFVTMTTLHGEIYVDLLYCNYYTSRNTALKYSGHIIDLLKQTNG